MKKDLLKEFIGARLLKVDESKNTIAIQSSDGSEYHLCFDDSDSGDCCGFNKLYTTLYISETEIGRNPVITNICFDEELSSGHKMRITLFGEYEPMVEVDATSYSRSGWGYGAVIKLNCYGSDFWEEEVTRW